MNQLSKDGVQVVAEPDNWHSRVKILYDQYHDDPACPMEWVATELWKRAVTAILELPEMRAQREERLRLAIDAFVQGAKWWEFHKTGATMWQSDQQVAYEKAVDRYAAEALWQRDYPNGGSIYKTYESLPLHDKELYRNEALNSVVAGGELPRNYAGEQLCTIGRKVMQEGTLPSLLQEHRPNDTPK